MPDYRCQFEGCDTLLSVWTIRDLGTMCSIHAEHDPCIDMHLPVCDECDSSRFMRPVGITTDKSRPRWACGRCQRIGQIQGDGSRAFNEIPWAHVDLVLQLDTPEARTQFNAWDKRKRREAKALKFCMNPEDRYRLVVLDEPRITSST